MNTVDIGIAAVILISLLIGWRRGFLREVLSLVSWVAALLTALRFAETVGARFAGVIDQPQLQVIAAFTLIFVAVLFAFSYFSHRLCLWLAFSGVTGVDRMLGILFGVARGALIVAALLLLTVLLNFAEHEWMQESALAYYFAPFVDLLRDLLPDPARLQFQPPTGRV